MKWIVPLLLSLLLMGCGVGNVGKEVNNMYLVYRVASVVNGDDVIFYMNSKTNVAKGQAAAFKQIKTEAYHMIEYTNGDFVIAQ